MSASNKRIPVESSAEPFEIRRHGRAFAVHDPAGDLVVIALYRKGAEEVVRRLRDSGTKRAVSR